MRRWRAGLLLGVLASVPCVLLSGQSGIPGKDRTLYRQMLKDLRKDLQDNYYDRSFRGIDLSQLFETSSQKVAEARTTMEAVEIIASTLLVFNDSHTSFIPPPRATKVQYGWTMAAVGDKALVLTVDAGSDAEKQGVAPGDEVVALNRLRPTRDNLWQIRHYYNVVRPQVQQRLVVRKPDGSERTVDVRSRSETRPLIQITDAFFDAMDEARKEADVSKEVEPGVLVWHMTVFREADDMAPFIKKAREAKGLVLDLRGNGGGLLDGLKALVGWMFDREIEVMTRIGRKAERRETAKPKSRGYSGPLVVLVDSRSASAAECFARIVQLEKRGTVVGDRTAGKVMTSQTFVHSFGLGASTFYGASVTVSDTRMSDGASLENAGVTPDEVLLPQAADLASGRDPVLARAVAILGGSLSPEQAGELLRRK